ncbi:MAG: acyl carrier protein [Phycisphaerae bacterium]|jgi:acyl carrier protein
MEQAVAANRVKQTIMCLFQPGLSAEQISDDIAIFDSGIGLDSMAAVTLVEGLEDAFGICIDNDDLTMENFKTVSAVAALICRKKGGVA